MFDSERRISIIVPLYRGNKYVNSIIDQVAENKNYLKNHGLSWGVEIVFVNDYPDEKIELNNTNEDGIKLVTNSCNKGIQGSRVEGLKHASGEFILMLDQDDEIKPNFIGSQLRLLEEHPDACVVVSNGIVEHNTYSRKIYEYKFMQDLTQDIKAYAYFGNRILSPGQCVIRKEAIPQYWKDSIMKMNGADDLLLWLLILDERGKKTIVPNHEVIYIHKNTHENASLNVEKMHASVDEMLDILRTKKDFDNNIINIADYRNCTLKKNYHEIRLNLGSKIIIKTINATRAIKNIGKS